jgi:ADP-ribose pyrophosphatase
LLELPAGLVDTEDSNPMAAAARELREETDLLAEKINHLLDFFTSPGYSDEKVSLFVASVQEPAPSATKLGLRIHEELELTWEWIDLDAAVRMVFDGTITNAICQIGILAIAIARPGLKSDAAPG